MVRVRTNAARHRRKKRVIKAAKGYFLQRHKRFRQAKRTRIKALTNAYHDRKAKKSEFRKLWTVRINAICRAEGLSYSRLINGLKVANVVINRKMLAELAVSSPEVFKQLIKIVREHLPAAKK